MNKKYASLRLFNAVAIEDSPYLFNPNYELNEQRGIVVAPSAMHRIADIKNYVEEKFLSGSELNSSFYSNWNKVKNLSLERQLRDQIFHYLTTYGFEALGFDAPEFVYIPNPGVKDIPDRLQLLVIKGVTKESLQERCFKLLSSGVALKQETIEDILYVLQNDCAYKFTGDEDVRNREAQVMIYDLTKVLPRNSEAVLRYLVYKATNETLVIKNKHLIDRIRLSGYVLPKLNVLEMAKTFNRYKPIWLAFKKANKENSAIVNKIAKLSKTRHVPMKPNVLANITSLLPSVAEVNSACETATPFQIARALNAVRLYKENKESRIYNVRNGKLFVKSADGKPFLQNKYEVPLIRALQEKISDKKVFIPDELDYALPVSEKMFSGNVPTGSSILAPIDSECLLVGIYWKDEGGSRTDLDLSAVNLTQKVGWNTRWSNVDGSLMYSGDMTSGYAGAAEWLYLDKSLSSSFLITVNLYSGQINKPFKVIVGHAKKSDIGHNYMIDPNKIIFEAECTMRKRQMMIGVIEPWDDVVKFTLLDRAVQNSRVSNSGQSIETLALDYVLKANKTSLRLRDFVKTVDLPDLADVDLSMQSLSKDSVLSMFN